MWFPRARATSLPTRCRHYCARKLPQPLLPLRWKYSQDSWLPRCRRALARPSKGNSQTWSAGLLPSRLLRRSGRRLRSQFRRQHMLRPRVLYLLRGPRPSWITQSITFIAGWWKSSPKGTLTPSATTRTPRPRAITNRTQSASFFGDSARAVLFWPSMSRSLVALMLIFGLPFGGTVDAAAQSSKHHRKSKKPKSPPCRTGCKPETSEPQVTADTPEDEATQKELSELARALHNAAPGAYEKLSAFAAKNATNVWGARAALALGYDEYMKNRSGQAVGLFVKAQNDTLLREYALYWTAQAQRALGRNADAYKVLQTVLHDYPTTAMREQVLEAFAPTAVQLGHAQEAIDALEAYSGTATKPTLLFERAHAYQAAHQLARAAKDYQTVFYKYPLADEAKPAGSALSQVMHALGKEYVYPGVEMQQQR